MKSGTIKPSFDDQHNLWPMTVGQGILPLVRRAKS